MLTLPINPQIIIFFVKERDKNNKIYPSKRVLDDFKETLKYSNEIIRNAEETVLMKSNNMNDLKNVIKINQKCLEKKHRVYKALKIKNGNPKEKVIQRSQITMIDISYFTHS